jgi:excisionase family DNA binding protein
LAIKHLSIHIMWPRELPQVGTPVPRGSYRMTTVKAIRPLDPNALSVSPEQAARFLSVHRRTVDRLIADRTLKARKAGRRVLVDMASIRAYYESLPVIGGA